MSFFSFLSYYISDRGDAQQVRMSRSNKEELLEAGIYYKIDWLEEC